MIDTDVLATVQLAAMVCVCGAARTSCPDCTGTGYQPHTRPRTDCPTCLGIGASRSHDWECPGLHVTLGAGGPHG
ncbi:MULTISPECIES: hypothetical protein [Kitasatospora]|uniref:DnaJ-class molecular chaperone n=2 Tax=Kitasatospora TaxID=2063 RepID=A0ABT1IVQ0_9ACTN|nr:hypothetical protein [Kitasatospora paracochleata]MCP2308986.1 DnaJ-class molecular chaperone [Kitasatospora paracochleata]